MGILQRQERVIAKIDILTEELQQGKGTVNFTCADGTKRFASFVTEESLTEGDMTRWLGKNSQIYEALQLAFIYGKVVILFLGRVNNGHDFVASIKEAAE